jgi:hypothetical protein
MSREVEVTGIKMTATVPEDLQISPGYTTSADNASYKGNMSYAINGDASFLTSLESGTTTNKVEGTTAKAPSNTDSQMWTNSLQLDHYYALGKIIPASSDNGANIFFTNEANDEGRGVQYDASFYQATSGNNESGTYMSSLHALTSGETLTSGTWTGYVQAASFEDTKSDGYYVDIPLWIRSSSKTAVGLSVKAQANYNTTAKKGTADIELYQAVRAVILTDNPSTGSGTAGLIDVTNASGATTRFGGPSIVDYYGRGSLSSGAVFTDGKLDGSYDSRNSGTEPNWTGIYKNVTMYNGTSSVVTVPASSTDTYGEPVKIWVRVWLEGEDPQCWNQNAAQDFTIDLQFTKVDLP